MGDVPSRTFFTVLITLYNCAEWIGPCLDSVLTQTFPSWNAIVIDDASTDTSWDAVQAKVGTDPRFRCVQNTERLTALPNLMRTTREATGDHIVILDGDDAFLRPDTLDIIFAVYNDAPNVIATSGQYQRWPDGGIGHCNDNFKDDWFARWPFGHTLTYQRDVCITMMDEHPGAYLDLATGRPYLTTYDLALFYPIVAWADWNARAVAHIAIPNYLYRRWDGNDDATGQGLAEQTLAARKIQLYWLNAMFRHDFIEQSKEATP